MAEAVLRAVRDRVMQLDVSWKGFGQLRGLPASDMLAVALLLVVFVTLVCALAQLEKHFSQEQGLPVKVSAYALLAQGYSRIKFAGDSQSSALACSVRTPKTIYRWTVSSDQLQQELQHLHRIYVRPGHYPESLFSCVMEEGCRMFFKENVLNPVNTVLRAEGHPLEYVLPGTCTRGGGMPDFSADQVVQGKSIGMVVAGECKTPTALKDVEDILSCTINAEGLRETICQTWGYLMDAEGDPDAGFFGTPDRVWFFRADRANEAMFVTDAIRCDAEAPSVRQMLYLLPRLRGRPLPTDAVQWVQCDLDRICLSEGGSGQEGSSQQGGSQQGFLCSSQQGGGGEQGGQDGSQGPVTRSQSKVAGETKQHAAAEALTSHNIIAVEEFQHMEPIGYGGSGPVSAAWLHGHHVAVKFGDCYNSKDIVRHLLNEVATYKALEPLQGTCIPRLVEHGYTMWGGSFFVATQLIKGRTHEEGSAVPMSQRHAAKQALEAIHAAGYLHGDVRCDNLIYEDNSGKAYFLDLGCSRKSSCAEAFQAEMRDLQALFS